MALDDHVFDGRDAEFIERLVGSCFPGRQVKSELFDCGGKIGMILDSKITALVDYNPEAIAPRSRAASELICALKAQDDA